ncbi:MAG: pyruvate dehydrogenase E2 component (dihydrolipoamide acetyltransferase) [Oleiphilaceae bacterium]|jgi:pyruvate dehydrogenase E2 component (dihydrolipoamide acetyltransferase)
MEQQTITVPDIGVDSEVEVIELCVAKGDHVLVNDALIVVESDKATVEIPSPFEGVVGDMVIIVGDQVRQGSMITTLSLKSADSSELDTQTDTAQYLHQELQSATAVNTAPEPAPTKSLEPATSLDNKPDTALGPRDQDQTKTAKPPNNELINAGPAIRKLAREFGVDLSLLTGRGQKGRLLKEDLHRYVKDQLTITKGPTSFGPGLPTIPEIDFSQFGEVNTVAMTRIQRLTADNMLRSWLNIPHVTQFDEVDITELEEFRREQKASLAKQGIKLTSLAFIVKAVCKVIHNLPLFNQSLTQDYQLVQKKYLNIGFAVDTEKGLMVPVIHNADTMSVAEIAQSIVALATKANEGKLSPKEMQGGCFTISSLGSIGGGHFTPIINAPEVAILGIGRSEEKPVYMDRQWIPREKLPLSLSYDHRVINGADGARFIKLLCQYLGDIRHMVL